MTDLELYQGQTGALSDVLDDRSTIVQALIACATRRSAHNYRDGRGTTQYTYKKSWVNFAAFLRYHRRIAPIDEWLFFGKDEIYLLDWLEGELPSITWHDVSRYREGMLAVAMTDRRGRRKVGLEASTVNVRLAALKHLFKIAIRTGRMTVNPASSEYVDRSKPARAYRQDEVTADEAIVVLRKLAPGASYLERRDYVIILLLVRMGLRRAELVGITSQDFGRAQEGMTLDIVRKGDKRQRLLVPDDLELILVDFVEAFNLTENLFTARTDNGRPLRPDDITDIVRRISTDTLGRTFAPHALRSTFITLAFDRGVPVQDVQRYVGHSSPTMTVDYTRDRLSNQRGVARIRLEVAADV